MTRTTSIIVVCLIAGLATGCSGATEPDPIPTPSGIDWESAAALGENGNGLWLLDGTGAMQEVLDATRRAESVQTSLEVQEMIPTDGGEPTVGRSITVERTRDGTAYQANFTIGDLSGEIISDGDEAWVRGNQALTTHLRLDETDDFQCIAAHAPDLADLTPFLDPETVLRTSVIGLQIGALPPESADAATVLTLGADSAPIGQILVSAHGAPLPDQLRLADESGSVHLDFEWETEVDISLPDAPNSCQ